MPCTHPLKAYRSSKRNPSGKYGIVFSSKDGNPDSLIELPCGQCIECRLERSRQWALRCVHEASLYEDNCFITLTYSQENMPPNGNLQLEDFQKFMKRLRKAYTGRTIRYYMCGEYGENLEYSRNGKFGHPHYHACLFNLDFQDKEPYSEREGVVLYTSKQLQELWPYGFVTVGEVTFESAAYTARYVMKKQLGKNASEHYSIIDQTTGEYLFSMRPEFTTMSRRPGIGKGWYEKYKGDLEKDFITSRGIKMKPPKFYDGLLEQEDPVRYQEVKQKRMEEAKTDEDPYEISRRQRDRNLIMQKKTKLLPRDI